MTNRETPVPDELPLGEGRTQARRAESRLAAECVVVLPLVVLALLIWLRFDARALVGLPDQSGSSVHRPGIAELLLIGTSAALPLLLWWSLRRARLENATWRGDFRPAFVSLIALAALGAVTAYPRFRWYLIEGTKARAEPNSFVRSVAYWQGDDIRDGNGGRRPRLFAVGSSQMNFAVDVDSLAGLLPKFEVRKRALPGFGIMQYLAVAPSLGLRRGDVIVCWLSEFDVFREDRLPANRLRFLSGAWQLATLARALGPRLVMANRGELADVGAAVVPGLWRDRDYWRTVTTALFWRAREAPIDEVMRGGPNADSAQRENLARSVRRTALLDANFRSFSAFVDYASSRGARVLVFEGSSRPDGMSAYDPSFRTETRQRLTRMAADGKFDYITSHQMPEFDATDFMDVYHLNTAAQRRFTRYLAGALAVQDGAPAHASESRIQ